MFSELMNGININYSDIVLFLSFYLVQQNNTIINIIGYVFLLIIVYIETKNQQVKNKYDYICIIKKNDKTNYKLYNNILESIYNKQYNKIDIMNCYINFINKLNNLDYDFDKINNCLEILGFMAKMDNIMFLDKYWARKFIEDKDILDIYAKLVNHIHNLSINSENDESILYKELENLYINFDYKNISNKITIFCQKYSNNINNICQMY